MRVRDWKQFGLNERYELVGKKTKIIFSRVSWKVLSITPTSLTAID